MNLLPRKIFEDLKYEWHRSEGRLHMRAIDHKTHEEEMEKAIDRAITDTSSFLIKRLKGMKKILTPYGELDPATRAGINAHNELTDTLIKLLEEKENGR